MYKKSIFTILLIIFAVFTFTVSAAAVDFGNDLGTDSEDEVDVAGESYQVESVEDSADEEDVASGEAPIGEVPVGEAPVTDAPVTDAPVTEAPGDAPSGGNPVGAIPVGNGISSEDIVNNNANVISGQMVVQGYEWGPAVPKIIIEFADIVSGFTKETFVVKTVDAVREIVDVYNCDATGAKQASATKYIAFELTVRTVSLFGQAMCEASPFGFNMETFQNKWADTYLLDLSLAENMTVKVGEVELSSANWDTCQLDLMKHYVVPETATWEKDTFTLDNITLQRASFTPEGAETDAGKNPLIIWLHGAGEGGLDIDVDLLGNEVVALAREEIQKYFTTESQKGAYVLAVQTPTMWMDKGDGTYNDSIHGAKQTSMYTDALFGAISDWVSNHPDVDTKRIYIGGCSNGGYMTMNLMFEHGDFFTAFYPICEAYMNENISDEMISQVKDYNVWFVHSEDDTTVDPLASSIPAYYRLIKAGAQNIHYTLYDHVVGTDDPNAVYMGHFSWIYAFNDQVMKEFDTTKVLEDSANVAIDANGKVTSTNNYVTNTNCNKQANMWSWMATQTK